MSPYSTYQNEFLDRYREVQFEGPCFDEESCICMVPVIAAYD